MTFTQNIIEDVLTYFDHIVDLKTLPEIINSAINGETRIVAKDLYDFFLKDKKLQQDLENVEFEKLAKEYNSELINSADIIRNTKFVDFNIEDFAPWNESFTSLIQYIDIKNKAPLKFRLYINVKPKKLSEFITIFLKQIFSNKTICPTCSKNCNYDKTKQQLICPECKNTKFYFVIKLHQPVKEKDEEAPKSDQDRLMSENVFLRRDKLILGFADKKVLISVLKMIKSFGSEFFSDKTPYLTHQVIPGIGISLEPNKTETEDYTQASQETEELITFEHYIVNIITENLVKKVQTEKDTIKDIFAMWKLDKEDIKKLYEKVKKVLILPLEKQLIEDKRLTRLFKEMEKIKSEMWSLEDKQ